MAQQFMSKNALLYWIQNCYNDLKRSIDENKANEDIDCNNSTKNIAHTLCYIMENITKPI
ncbi:MAG: hypothetical protein IJ848_01565 [Alphaproteobacteria bacterium]|nr:hypothetical protein [Alphaproteobacteria bacterium]